MAENVKMRPPRVRAYVHEIQHKNNRFLRRLRLDEIRRLRLLMQPRLRYYLLLEVTAASGWNTCTVHASYASAWVGTESDEEWWD